MFTPEQCCHKDNQVSVFVTTICSACQLNFSQYLQKTSCRCEPSVCLSADEACPKIPRHPRKDSSRITRMFCCVYNFSQHVGRKYLCQSPNCINQIYSPFTIGYVWTQKDPVRAPNGEIENNANVCHKTSNWRFLHAPSHSMTNSTQTRNHKGLPACRVEKYRRIHSWH